MGVVGAGFETLVRVIPLIAAVLPQQMRPHGED